MLRWIIILIFPLSISAQLKRFQFAENKMGSPFRIIFYHEDSASAVLAAKECFNLIDSLNMIFSDYMPHSEISRLSQSPTGNPQPVSDDLLKIILLSKEAWIKSGRTFDITIGNLSALWRKAKTEKRFPSKKEIRIAKSKTGFEKIDILEDDKSIILNQNGMLLDFGGIVKGYAAQKVIDYLKSKNIFNALADAGGDIAVSEAPPDKQGWTIAVNMPEQGIEVWDKKLELTNCAVATSGDVYRFTIHKGKKYSHIIDPHTGYGITSLRNVTVIAKDGTTADWLATACSILSIEKALELVRKENAALLIAILKDEKIIIYKSENFESFFKKKEP